MDELMSLSSINVIRNSSFDLFQIFHRLSIFFVILLALHPLRWVDFHSCQCDYDLILMSKDINVFS